MNIIVGLTAEQLVVALQALSDYQERLNHAIRHREKPSKRLLDEQRAAADATQRLSTAYIKTDL